MSSCPVENTCPLIDKVINLCNKIQSEEDLDIISNCVDDIMTIMEKIREANSDLRSWGEELYEIIQKSVDLLYDVL